MYQGTKSLIRMIGALWTMRDGDQQSRTRREGLPSQDPLFEPEHTDWFKVAVRVLAVAVGALFLQGAGNHLVGIEPNPGPKRGKGKGSRQQQRQRQVARKVKEELEKYGLKPVPPQIIPADIGKLFPVDNPLIVSTIPVPANTVVNAVAGQVPAQPSGNTKVVSVEMSVKASPLAVVDKKAEALSRLLDIEDDNLFSEKLAGFLDEWGSASDYLVMVSTCAENPWYNRDGSIKKDHPPYPTETVHTCGESPWFMRDGTPKPSPDLPHPHFDEGPNGDGIRRRYVGPPIEPPPPPTDAEKEKAISDSFKLKQTEKQYNEFLSLNTPQSAGDLVPNLKNLPIIDNYGPSQDLIRNVIKPCLNMGRWPVDKLPHHITLAEAPRDRWRGIVPARYTKKDNDFGIWRGLLNEVGLIDRLEAVDRVLLVGIPVFLLKQRDVRPWRDKADLCRDDVLLCVQPMILILYKGGEGRFHTVDADFHGMTPASSNWFGDTFQFSVPHKEDLDQSRVFKRFDTILYSGATHYATDRHLVYRPLWVSLYQLVELFSRKSILAPRLLVSTTMERMVRFAAEDTLTSVHLDMRLVHEASVSRDTLSFLACLAMGDATTRLEDF